MAETEQQNRQTKMLKDPIGSTLIGLGLPMVLGILAIMLFNIVDTIYVGRLGSSRCYYELYFFRYLLKSQIMATTQPSQEFTVKFLPLKLDTY